MRGQSEKRVREILKQNEQRFRESSSSAIDAILSGRSRAKKRRPSDTVKQIMEALEEQALAFVTEAGSKVAGVTTDAKAYVLISEAVESFWKYLRSELRIVLEKVVGHSVSRIFLQEVNDEWGYSHGRVISRLESYRMSFPRPTAGTAPEKVSDEQSSGLRKGRGGRPPAEYWDQLWAAIATALYFGDLKPKRQVDIEKAMADWIADHGHSASPSNIRKRARILWQNIEFVDE